jgi:hypothetical protein
VDDNVYAPNLISGLGAGDAIKFGVDGSATLAGPASGGEIDFSPSAVDYARLNSGSKVGATSNNFGAGDEVDFEAVKYASNDKLVYAKGLVSIDNSVGHTVASFRVSGTHTSANFKLNDDGSGHILVSYVATAASVAADEVSGGRSTDLLGRYGAAFAEPLLSDALAFDAWTALGSAGTYSGGFDFHHDAKRGRRARPLGRRRWLGWEHRPRTCVWLVTPFGLGFARRRKSAAALIPWQPWHTTPSCRPNEKMIGRQSR